MIAVLLSKWWYMSISCISTKITASYANFVVHHITYDNTPQSKTHSSCPFPWLFPDDLPIPELVQADKQTSSRQANKQTSRPLAEQDYHHKDLVEVRCLEDTVARQTVSVLLYCCIQYCCNWLGHLADSVWPKEQEALLSRRAQRVRLV